MIFKVLLIFVFTGCTVTITPIKKTKPKTHHVVKHKSKPKAAASSPHQISDSSTIVDHEWLIEYKRLEEVHGDYTIKDDDKVESVGSGKYKVTPAMLEHFKDLTQTPEP